MTAKFNGQPHFFKIDMSGAVAHQIVHFAIYLEKKFVIIQKVFLASTGPEA